MLFFLEERSASIPKQIKSLSVIIKILKEELKYDISPIIMNIKIQMTG